MLSVKKAREHCGWKAKPDLPTCGNCGAFASDLVAPAWMRRDLETEGAIRVGNPARIFKTVDALPDSYKVESGLRCVDHGFSTKKTASCKLWRPKQGA
jgi:hypothetical protein